MILEELRLVLNWKLEKKHWLRRHANIKKLHTILLTGIVHVILHMIVYILFCMFLHILHFACDSTSIAEPRSKCCITKFLIPHLFWFWILKCYPARLFWAIKSIWSQKPQRDTLVFFLEHKMCSEQKLATSICWYLCLIAWIFILSTDYHHWDGQKVIVLTSKRHSSSSSTS